MFWNQYPHPGILRKFTREGAAVSSWNSRGMHDIALALMAVQAQTTDVLSDFPTTAATEPAQTPES